MSAPQFGPRRNRRRAPPIELSRKLDPDYIGAREVALGRRRRRLPRRGVGETAKWLARIHLATISALQVPTPHGCPPRRIVRSIPCRRPGPTPAKASRLPGVFSPLFETIAAISAALFSKLRTAQNGASRPVTRSSSPLSSARGMSAAPYALLSTPVASAFLLRSSSSRTRRDHRGRLPNFQWYFANLV